MVSVIDADLRQLAVAVACQIVAAVLTAVLDLVPKKSSLVGDGSEKGYECKAATFFKEMVSLFMAPAISMLSQPLDVGMRHHAMLNWDTTSHQGKMQIKLGRSKAWRRH
jgi:hypothetical protein